MRKARTYGAQAPFVDAMSRIRTLQDEITVCVSAREWSQVVRLGRRLQRLEPGNLIALEATARAHWHLGQYPQSLECLRRLIARNPHEPGYLGLQAACHEQLGQFAAAGECLRRAIGVETHERTRADLQTRLDTLECAIIATIEQSAAQRELLLGMRPQSSPGHERLS